MSTTRVARIAALALATTLALAACSDGSQGPSDAAGQNQASGESLDAAAFADLAATAGSVVLDVRTPEEYAAGHLDGAVNLDVSAADFATRVADLDPDATYAVYCRSGNRSQVAMQRMREAGIATVADLSSGIQAWVQAGREITTGP